MKAFLNNGKGLGSNNSIITKDYKTIRGLYVNAILPFYNQHGYCKAEVFYNWDNRYKMPDIIIEVDKNKQKYEFKK